MADVFALARRHVALYLRDRATVFFSFLSVLILVALYFMFVAKLYSADLLEMGGAFTAGAVNYLVYAQMMAGVLVLNSLSLSLGAFSAFVKDFETRRIDSFLLTPVKVAHLIFSFFLSGVIVSLALNLLAWGLSAALIGALTGYWIAAPVFARAAGVVFLASLASSSVLLLFAAVMKSSGAVGVFNGVAGTVFGFLCGIYIPYGALGGAVVKVGSLLPFTHLTIWMKQIVLGGALAQIGLPDAMRGDMLRRFSALNVGLAGLDVPLAGCMAYTAVFALACLIAAGAILARRIKR
jgi:multidrug/hemolysin transport system permease protein